MKKILFFYFLSTLTKIVLRFGPSIYPSQSICRRSYRNVLAYYPKVPYGTLVLNVFLIIVAVAKAMPTILQNAGKKYQNTKNDGNNAIVQIKVAQLPLMRKHIYFEWWLLKIIIPRIMISQILLCILPVMWSGWNRFMVISSMLIKSAADAYIFNHWLNA